MIERWSILMIFINSFIDIDIVSGYLSLDILIVDNTRWSRYVNFVQKLSQKQLYFIANYPAPTCYIKTI